MCTYIVVFELIGTLIIVVLAFLEVIQNDWNEELTGFFTLTPKGGLGSVYYTKTSYN